MHFGCKVAYFSLKLCKTGIKIIFKLYPTSFQRDAVSKLPCQLWKNIMLQFGQHFSGPTMSPLKISYLDADTSLKHMEGQNEKAAKDFASGVCWDFGTFFFPLQLAVASLLTVITFSCHNRLCTSADGYKELKINSLTKQPRNNQTTKKPPSSLPSFISPTKDWHAIGYQKTPNFKKIRWWRKPCLINLHFHIIKRRA